MIHALIVCGLAMLAGLGVGSAGLLVTYLVLVEGVAQITAQGLNLLFFLCSSGVALLIHARRTPLFWREVLLMIATGTLGSLLGVQLAGRLPQAVLRRLFGGFLILSGAKGLFRKRKAAR
jgi:uncharacterized membrane protein YfcA